MKGLLFFHEESRFQNQLPYIDRLASLYGFDQTIVVDLVGHPLRPYFWYQKVEDALSDPAFENCQWVWLSAKASIYLDEFRHPEDDVIYCVGSDLYGFFGADLGGTRVRLRQPEDQQGEWFAAIVVPLVCYDRFLYLEGRRK